ncbi:peptidase M84 [Bacillus salacetis]|uniref:Peptidase M84 n=1 Tax=Bacillus salacetis TaxID=2315464 RepID=A0A3A1QYF4_9BACI|nr:peptidase M84 [Bacillus salacetis]
MNLKKSKIAAVTLALSLSVAPAFSIAKDKAMETDHHHDHTVTSTYVDSLPKAKEFAPDKGPAVVEKSTNVVELDENGKVKASMNTEKTLSSKNTNKAQAKAAATKTVTVLAVADEEYRAAYSDWQTRVQQIVEKADDAFTRDHGIDFQVQAVANWSSQGGNSSQILSDLSRDWSGYNYDFVVGFTRDANFEAGGIAYVYPSAPGGSAFSVNLDQGVTNTAKAAQHEFSHNYGLSHDAQGSGIRCVMNYDYSYSVDYWHPGHNTQIQNNKSWYGN